MAVTRNSGKIKKVSVLESASINLSEGQGYKGDIIKYEIETIPEDYDVDKNIFLIPEDDDVKVNQEKKEIYITTDEIKDVEIKLKDIPTESVYDNVVITASGENPKDVKEVKNPVKKKVTKKVTKKKNNEDKKDDKKVEDKKVKVNRIKKDTKKKPVKKTYSNKSYTKEEMLNDLSMILIDKDNNPAYSKKELNDIVSLIDEYRSKALKDGKTVSMKDINFSRKLQKGRIHSPNLETVKNDSLVTPHIVMQAKVESEDKKVIKGKQIDKTHFEDENGDKYDLDEINEKFKGEFDSRFK